METLVYVLGVAIGLLSLGWVLVSSFSMWEAKRRADEVLRAVLTQEQCRQLTQRGYLDIPSPSDPERIYRVPRTPGFVQVRERGRVKMKLCLQPLEYVPDADIVVIHKLMIEADEQTYLHKANVIGWVWDPYDVL